MRFEQKEQTGKASTGTPLFASQERIWVLDQLHPQTTAQNLAAGFRLSGPLDRAALEGALNQVVQRHEILRTVFHAVDGVPSQSVLATAPVTIDVINLRNLSPQERESQLTRLALEQAQVLFDLSSGPMLRSTLFQLGDSQQVFLLVTHRMVCDPASVRLLLSEIASHLTRGSGILPQISERMPKCGQIFQQEPAPAELSYWTQKLRGSPSTIDLPRDHQRPPVQSFRGGRQKLDIGSELLERLKDLGRVHGTSLFSVLLTAINVLLFRYSRQDDIVVGTRVSGRASPELANLIGPLENMLALRTDVSGEASFADLLERVSQATSEAFAHQDIPFEILLRQLRLERDMSRHPLFQVTFALEEDEPAFPLGLHATPFEVEIPSEQFDLAVECTLKQRTLEATFRYNQDLYDASTIRRILGHFRHLLEAAVETPAHKVSRMPLIGEAERCQLLVEWNNTQVQYPTEVSLHRFIEKQVETTPEALAVVFESEQLTYRELNLRANQLAHHLQKCGVGPDVLVGVCAERSLELVTALLAIVKAGGAYVPLDPEYPRDRLAAMLSDANPPMVLTQAHLLDRVPSGTHRVFCLDHDWPSLQNESGDNLFLPLTGQNLVYAIYTSGSTGKPKGVLNVHQGIVNRLLWMQDNYQLTNRDRVLQKTPFSFDVSVWEFFWPLMTGATIVVARPGGHRDPEYLVDVIARQAVTTIHFVPSMLSIFLEASDLGRCRTLRLVFASGEALPFELQQRFFERLGAELHNLYGPTEAAVDVTYWACRRDNPHTIVPIGRPIANTQIYILDANLQPTPIGVAGELHIGGINLARGYLNKPDLTAQKFIPDPFRTEPGARLYKTGDLARSLADGNIEYLGRIDDQVKLRGFRIELGEIEAVLGECAGVQQAVVTVHEDVAGSKQLVAYLIPAPGQDLSIDRLRKEIKDTLPEYMVPSRFVVVKDFPMTTSGKVDRKGLPAPPLERGTSTAAIAPRNQLESQIASVFARVLGLPSVGVADNFFDLGGHSLLAVRLLSGIEQMTGRRIPLSALFRRASVESLAQLITHELDLGSDPVVMEIQRGETRRLPFFAIVPPGEESLGYAMLARHMSPAQTVFKIQGHSPVTHGKRPYTDQEMRDLTAEYMAAIRSVRPHGPYCLGGLCDGAHVAELIIRALEAQGDEVALFAIFDTWVLQHSQNRWLWRVHYYGERLRQMQGMRLSDRLASYKRVAANRIQSLAATRPPTDWEQTYWPEDFTVSKFRAPVLLFKRPKQPFYYVNDPEMGWGKRTEAGIEILQVDLDHVEILREPHVRVFGEALTERITRLSRRTVDGNGSSEPASQPRATSPQKVQSGS